MKPAPRVLCAAAVAILIVACGGTAPLGPTPLDQGIVVYLHSGYRGTSQQIGADVADLSKAEGPCAIDENGGGGSWNDCISSIRVLPGWTARLYGDRNFRGAVLEVASDTADLAAIDGDCSGSYNDCISSIRVIKTQ
jgi:Peptidase inhibitor family I36